MENGKKPDRICGNHEEIFILSPNGSVIHLLPGEACPSPGSGSREILFQRKTRIWLPVGAGGFRDGFGNIWGGFCMVFCALILPRRFVIQNLDRLLPGDKPEQILTERMRGILKTQMENRISGTNWRDSAENIHSLWDEVRSAFEKELQGTGWEMLAFRPEKIRQIGR